jgi:hypothetical protein
VGSPAIHFDLFFDVLGVALAGRRLEPSHGPTPRHIVFSITDETASVDASGPVNPPAGAIASLHALTITMTTKEVRLERGRTAPADAEVALVRGSLAAMTAYLLVGDGRALSSLSLYGRVESLVELGEVLRSQKSMLSLRAEEAPPSKRRRRGAR